MIKHLLLLSLLFFISVPGFPQEYAEDLTVMATSGLNLREKPDLNSKVLARIPFGTIVKANRSQFGIDHPRTEIVIDNARGYWAQVKYQSHIGYIFSARTKRGADCVVQASGKLNNAYRILKEGYYCEFSSLNYSPDLNWYALILDGKQSKLRKVKVSIKTANEFSDLEQKEADQMYLGMDPLKVETDIDERSYLLIGSKSEFPVTGHINQTYIFEDQDPVDPKSGRFLYPEEKLSLYCSSLAHQISASERVILDSSEAKFRKEYNLNYTIQGRIQASADLSRDLDLSQPASKHARFQTPQLVWAGDLNGDGLLDLIFYSFTMVEHCGMNWYHHLFMTDQDSNPVIRKVAVHGEASCH